MVVYIYNIVNMSILTYIDYIDIIKQTRTQSLEGYNEAAGYKEKWRRVKAWYPGKHQKMNRMVYIEMFINPI